MNIVITDRQIGDIGDYRNYYLLQMNEVNGGDNVFVRCVCVCLSVCVSVRSGPMGVKS